MASPLVPGQRIAWTGLPTRPLPGATSAPEPLRYSGLLVSVDPDRGQSERWATVRYDGDSTDSRVFLDQLTPAP